jgi:hypothetical protein
MGGISYNVWLRGLCAGAILGHTGHSVGCLHHYTKRHFLILTEMIQYGAKIIMRLKILLILNEIRKNCLIGKGFNNCTSL